MGQIQLESDTQPHTTTISNMIKALTVYVVYFDQLSGACSTRKLESWSKYTTSILVYYELKRQTIIQSTKETSNMNTNKQSLY